jgi:hypothetical protein
VIKNLKTKRDILRKQQQQKIYWLWKVALQAGGGAASGMVVPHRTWYL